MPRKFQSPTEVARDLGVHRKKVLALIDRRELSAVNLAIDANGQRPRWRISPDALDAFLASRAAN
jgi:excisionase family DNA binding protein